MRHSSPTRARTAMTSGKLLPIDPYHKNWTGLGVRALFEAVGEGALYDVAYRPLSDWHHWSPAGLARVLNVTPTGYAYAQNHARAQASAINLAFYALCNSADILCEHLRLPQLIHLRKLREELTAFQEMIGLIPPAAPIDRT